MNQTQDTLKIVNDFLRSFHMTPLYDCGFAEYTPCCAEDYQELYENLSFTNGAAQVARLMAGYMSPQWQICNLLSIAAQTLKLKLKDAAVDYKKIQNLCEQYTREFTSLLEKKKNVNWLEGNPI